MGTPIGMDQHHFYRLKIQDNKAGPGNIGFIDGWSRETLTRDFSRQLSMPVKNAEAFRFVGFSAEEGKLQVFYSFFSKENGRLVLAVASFDENGDPNEDAREIFSVDGKQEKRTGQFMVLTDPQVHLTAVFMVRSTQPLGQTDAMLEPAFTLTVLDRQLKPINQAQYEVPGCKGFTLLDVMLGADGSCAMVLNIVGATLKNNPTWCQSYNRYMLMDHNGKISELCAGNLSDYGEPRNLCRFIRDERGEPVFVRGERSQVYVARFNGPDTLPIKTTIDPMEYGVSDYGLHLLDAAYDGNGELQLVWLKLASDDRYANVRIRKGYITAALSRNREYSPYKTCGAEQRFNLRYGSQQNLASLVIHVGTHIYVVTSQLREDIGKRCEELTAWKRLSPLDEGLVLSYMCLDAGNDFGPFQQLVPGDSNPHPWITMQEPCSIPGTEYIFLYEAKGVRRFVRVRAVN